MSSNKAERLKREELVTRIWQQKARLIPHRSIEWRDFAVLHPDVAARWLKGAAAAGLPTD